MERTTPPLNRSLLAAVFALVALTAGAQVGRVLPGASYFVVLEELYDAEFRDAVRGFRSELRGAVKTTTDRWLDSICYHTMLGETFFQQNEYALALEQFDAALDLFLRNRDWLTTVELNQPVRVDNNLARLRPPWAAPRRPVRYVDVPANFLVSLGRIDQAEIAQRGGVIQVQQFWQLDAQELARGIAWALYRRGELLGPVAPHDPLQRSAADAVARGGLAPLTPWSNAWVALWQGVGAATLGNAKTALPQLQRAALIDGVFDHPLTGMALLVQGKLALEAKRAEAPALLREAAMAGLIFEDFLVVNEALRFAHQLQLSVDARPVRWIEPLAALCVRRREGTAIRCRLAMAESMLAVGDTNVAQRLIRTALGRRRDAARSGLGRELQRLSAMAVAQSGDAAKADSQARQLITDASPFSLRRFRRAVADRAADTRRLSPRVAGQVYESLLADPSASAWRDAPLDCLSDLQDDASPSFARWFQVAASRRNPVEVLRAWRQEQRRRLLAGLPLGGRRHSLRQLLDGPAAGLADDSLVAKATVVDRFRGYAEWATRGAPLRQKLMADPANPAVQRAWEATLAPRETVITQISLSRQNTPLLAAPATTADDRAALPASTMIIAFRWGADAVHAMAITSETQRVWRVGEPKAVLKDLVAYLKAIAGAGARQQWSAEQLTDDTWRTAATSFTQTLLADAPAEIVTAERLVFVPDGPLWHAPWAGLVLRDGSDADRLLIEQAMVSVSPTIDHALRPRRERGRIASTAVVRGASVDAEATRDPVALRAPGAKPFAAKLPASLAVIKPTFDSLVVDTDSRLPADDPASLRLSPASRGSTANLREWRRLPAAAPQVLVLAGLNTAADDLSTAPRARNREGRLGDEVFHTVCSLLSPGVDSLLVTRWSSGGLRQRELIAEFLVGRRSLDGAAAWRRSVELTSPRRLKVLEEPRLDAAAADATDPITGEHPVFWAAIMLVE